jgi:septum formation protein
VEEEAPAVADPHWVAQANARAKAESVPGALVLGADTVVALGTEGVGELLGKPVDAEDARRMLQALSGSTHRVVTGHCLRRGIEEEVRTVETLVRMRTLTPDEIDAYIASGEGFGKAGGYAIQETAERFVESIRGPLDNVIGLCVETVREMLTKMTRETY